MRVIYSYIIDLWNIDQSSFSWVKENFVLGTISNSTLVEHLLKSFWNFRFFILLLFHITDNWIKFCFISIIFPYIILSSFFSLRIDNQREFIFLCAFFALLFSFIFLLFIIYLYVLFHFLFLFLLLFLFSVLNLGRNSRIASRSSPLSGTSRSCTRCTRAELRRETPASSTLSTVTPFSRKRSLLLCRS